MPDVIVENKVRVIKVELSKRDGFTCIKLDLENAKSYFLNLDSFIKNRNLYDQVLQVYKSLSGKYVTLRCWDPAGQRGRYSSNFWFKDAMVNNEDEKVQKNIIRKGYCGVCGIADGLLSYKESKSADWSHFKCKNRSFASGS